MTTSITFTKRKKIILVTLLISLSYFISHNFSFSILQKTILGFFLTYFSTAWILDFDFKKEKYFVFPIIPVLFYLSMLLSYPILERLKIEFLTYPILLLGIYIILLTLNILNISIVRPIPLAKAAWISLSLLRFIISFLVYTFLYWFHFDWYLLLPFIFIFTIFLSYPGFFFLIQQLGRGVRSLHYILITTLIVSEIAYLLIFWELSFYRSGLILAAFLYIITGIFEAHLRAVLKKSFFWEYGVVAIFSFILLFLL